MPGALPDMIKAAVEWAATRKPGTQGFHEFFYAKIGPQYSSRDRVIDEWVHKGWIRKYPAILEGKEVSFDVMHMTEEGTAFFRSVTQPNAMGTYAFELATKAVKEWLNIVEATTQPQDSSPEGFATYLKDAPVYLLSYALLNDLEEGLTGVVEKPNEFAKEMNNAIIKSWIENGYLIRTGNILTPTAAGIIFFRQL